MYLFLLIIIYKLLIDVREVKTRFKLKKHIDTEKTSEAVGVHELGHPWHGDAREEMLKNCLFLMLAFGG
jgi:hypothetical protein